MTFYRFHRKDVLDLQWSTDGTFLIPGSVDSTCIIWDVNKGSVHQILDGHSHYVQGVAWDPLAKFLASLSSDRTCRIYVNKPSKTKGNDRMNYICQYVISRLEPQTTDESKTAKNHLFHDETLPSFFRRLAWSPDGSFLLVPAGIALISCYFDISLISCFNKFFLSLGIIYPLLCTAPHLSEFLTFSFIIYCSFPNIKEKGGMPYLHYLVIFRKY
ncbi:unnamed protein product [Coffea canephora]|uniref:DH200=94 genomic scaffold, scaffold_13189 n=1 Tax=Coffea canephora TaxID=49390 RepID=A0A068VNC6_COFCA|nr:unnamed protein product [Coffea canephora]